MSADLALQKSLVSRLKGDTALNAMVPPENIYDRHALPAPSPSIILGESQAIEEGDIARKVERIFFTMHVWKRELGLRGVKEIAGAIRTAVNRERFAPVDGYHIGDCRVSQMRYLRDPDNETSHGVVTIEALVMEI